MRPIVRLLLVRILPAAALAAGLGLGPSGARAQTLKFSPPPVASLKCQKDPAPVATDRDWSAWKGEDTGLKPDDLFEIARMYTSGSGSVDADPALARRMFEHLLEKGATTKSVRQALAKAIVASSTDKAEIAKAVALLEEAVSHRDIGAALALGEFYERGKVVPRNTDKALLYFRMGVASGDSQAQLGIARLARAGSVAGMDPAEAEKAGALAIAALMVDLAKGQCEAADTIGRLYQTGDILPLDNGLAAGWYALAARAAHHAKAAEAAAWMYGNGSGVELSPTLAFEFLKIAAAGGRPRAMVSLGQTYALGDGTPKDSDKAIYWFERAVRAKQTVALRWLVRAWRGEFGGKEDLEKAFAYLKRSVERPNPERKAVFELGEAYVNGTGTPKDITLAIKTLERGASIGSDDAASLLGNILEFGQEGVPADPVRAARYYRLAASLGSVGAMTSLAEMHRCGRGVAWSTDLARRWTERAAFKGSGASMLRYALSLPATTPEEQARRLRLLSRAAALGSREAMAALSLAYAKGDGVAADKTQADAWRAKALAEGDDAARGYIAFAGQLLNGDPDPTAIAAARALLESGATQSDPRGSYELSRFLTSQGNDTRARKELTEAAIGKHPPAMRALAKALAPGEVVEGLDAKGWLAAADVAGDLRARIERASADPADPRARLDAVAGSGICTSIEFAEAAAAYLKLPGSSDEGRGKLYLDRAISVAGGDVDTLYLLADILLRSPEADSSKSGLDLLRRAADAGLTKAMRRLALGYEAGQFGPVDVAEAQRWLEKAAARGEPKSAVDFAKLVAKADPPNPEQMARVRDMLARIAERAPAAARQLGDLALSGALGVASRNEAAGWFMMAAKAGDGAAMRSLARLYGSGDGGVDRDPAESLAWMKRAAEAGERRAMVDVASAYETGFGAPADPAAAAGWFAKANPAGATVASP